MLRRRIFSLDEKCLSTSQNRRAKCLSCLEKKSIHAKTRQPLPAVRAA
jgi:hypothetical protein